jgi:hypothetical protein
MGKLVTYFKAKFFLLKEQGKTIRNHYSDLRFALFDVSIALSSLFLNPYRLCRKFLEKKGAPSINGYGETPFSTFKQLAMAANITSKDHYLELGSGRGKTCVWASLFCKCEVTGIEWVPQFFYLSRNLCRLFRIPVNFELKSMFDTDLSRATVLYIYSTQLTKDEMEKISFSSMSLRARIISVSQPLPNLPILKTISVTYPWGETQAFIQMNSTHFLL